MEPSVRNQLRADLRVFTSMFRVPRTTAAGKIALSRNKEKSFFLFTSKDLFQTQCSRIFHIRKGIFFIAAILAAG
jgi:hypothetical protein